jgi:FkbM family methyltransferase
LSVTCRPSERIGEALVKTGAYDTGVLEVLARLTGPGETCVDIGANFGLMTGVLARAAGSGGTVHCFEPHPGLRARLERHLEVWAGESASFAKVELHASAVSDRAGEAELHLPVDFDANEGTASLEAQGGGGESFTVPTVLLDEVFADEKIGVLKIDIEGHEKAALEGAAGLLGRHAVRDVVYEDHEGYPSAVSGFLEGHGYRVFRIDKGLLGPLLRGPEIELPSLPNFLATADPERALARIKARGYRVLSGFS